MPVRALVLVAALAAVMISAVPAPARPPVTNLPANVPAPVQPDPHVSTDYSPDGRILTVWNGTARLWDGDGKAERAWGCAAPVETAWFTPDGTQVLARHGAVGGDHTGIHAPGTVLFDVKTGKVALRWPGLLPALGDDGQPLMARNGRLILGRSAGGFRLMYNARGGQSPVMKHDHATHVALSPKGDFALTGDAEGRVILWETKFAGKRWERQLADPIDTLAFSPDGRYVLAGGGRHSVVWSRTDGAEAFTGGPSRMSRADRVVAELRGKSLVLRNIPDGTPVCTWRHKLRVVDFGFSASGTKVFVVGPTRSEVWAVPGCEQEKRRNTTMMRPRIGSYSLAEDGSQLLMAGYGMASLWVFPTRKRPTAMYQNWPTPAKGAYPVTFGPKGKRLLTPASDHTVNIVSLPDGAVIGTLDHGDDRAHCVDAGAPF